MEITVYNAQGTRAASPDDLPRLLASEADVVWVDMTGPTEDDQRVMREVFRFHPLAIEDTMNQQQRPKIEEYPDHLFFILNPIDIRDDVLLFHELDIFVGKNYVVTVHAAPEPVVAEARRRLSSSAMHPPPSTGFMLYTLMDSTIDGYFPVMDDIGEAIENVENEVLHNPRQTSLNHLFRLKRMMINLWRVVWPQREILNALFHHQLPFIDQNSLQFYMRDVSDHLMWLADMVNTFRDSLTSVTDLYMSAVSNRLNRVVNRLTVFALAIGVLTVFGGFYGMNFAQTWPPFSAPWGVPVVIGMMAAATAALLYLFRKMGWY